MDSRAHPRFRTEVMLDFAIGENRTAGMTWDVSKRGMFVRTSRMPDVGARLLITLRFPEGKQLLLQGEVVRTFTAPNRGRDDLELRCGRSVRCAVHHCAYHRVASRARRRNTDLAETRPGSIAAIPGRDIECGGVLLSRSVGQRRTADQILMRHQ